MEDFFLTCPRGLEDITATQVSKYITNTPVVGKGGISFAGDMNDMYLTNLHSRTGMHLLKKILSFESDDIEKIYSRLYEYDWGLILDASKTFLIKTKSNSKFFKNTNFVTLKIKDAIVDNIRMKEDKRPSIDKINPDVILFVIIHDNQIKIYIDSSGEPLFKRGYRTKIHKAALNESLAAGIIYLSNWDRKSPLYDIMCGSGTIPIESAMMAYNIPPGIFRGKFAFQKWDNYDHSLWVSTVCKLKEKINFDNDVEIFGSDYFKKNIELSLDSSKKIGIENIHFTQSDIKDFSPQHSSGTMILNPPYGVRVGEEHTIKKLYKQLGDLFKNQCDGFNIYFFTGNLEAIKSIGLRSKKRIILKNGKLDCRLLHYPITSGKFQ